MVQGKRSHRGLTVGYVPRWLLNGMVKRSIIKHVQLDGYDYLVVQSVLFQMNEEGGIFPRHFSLAAHSTLELDVIDN